MRYWTWAEIKEKVNDDLDLQDETFIDEAELLRYANEAIDEAESEIHGLYEDYFLSRDTISLVSGTDEYDMPTDIYANKIRDIVYVNGSTVYSLRRLRDWHKFQNYEVELAVGAGTVYEYFLLNTTPGSPKIVFSPRIRETGDFIKVYYLRNANRLTIDADICDIPEFVHFVMAFMKYKCLSKEGHPNTELALSDLERQRQQMVSTLAGMVPDSNNEIEADLSHYREHS